MAESVVCPPKIGLLVISALVKAEPRFSESPLDRGVFNLIWAVFLDISKSASLPCAVNPNTSENIPFVTNVEAGLIDIDALFRGPRLLVSFNCSPLTSAVIPVTFVFITFDQEDSEF